MRIRFTLSPKMDADLIARIEEKANGGSINEAAKFLLRFWYEQELGQKVSSSGQNAPTNGLDLSGLDSLNLD